MLAELQQLSNSLVRFGLSTPEVHPWVKPLKRGPFIIASLDANGTICKVELKEASEKSGVREVRKNNHNAFPAFKLACPLYKIAAEDPVRKSLVAKQRI
jgi:hypothetical protein